MSKLESVSVKDFSQQLKDGRHGIEEGFLMELFDKVIENLQTQSNVLYLQNPIIICGDIHGQSRDLIQLFEKANETFESDKLKNNYIFLGDYVDRGYCSFEVFAFLAFLMLKYPTQMYLLRGNHEYRSTNQQYGLFQDCLQTYGHAGVWYAINNTFDYLPLAAVIDNQIFCVHGGLSPKINYIGQINSLDRTKDYNDGEQSNDYFDETRNKNDLNYLYKSLADLTWSDPDNVKKFIPNRRGSGYLFGPEQTFSFLYRNGLIKGSPTPDDSVFTDDTKIQTKRRGFIARAHQLAQEGYQWFHNDNLCIVWSAPNYAYKNTNAATFLTVDNDKAYFTKFDPHKQSSVKPDDALLDYFA